MRHRSRTLLLLAILSCAAGCAQPVKRRDWSDYAGPGAAAFQREVFAAPGFGDPLEPANRGVWKLNDGLIRWGAYPIARVYRLVVPRFARDRLRDFAVNLEFPRNLVANLLQGEWFGARDETLRFAINVLYGIGGLWDPATHWAGIPPASEDFGQVFARWGWRHSTYVVLPILGPSTVRDGIGLLPDMALDPAQLFFPAGPVLMFNDMVDSIDEYKHFAASSFDMYDDARLLASFAREVRIEEPLQKPIGDDTGAVQTLGAALLTPRDPGFARRLAGGAVYMPGTGRELPFSYRMQRGAAPLVFIVPGLGAHRLGGPTLALAEMVWERGYSVAIVSSALHPEFIARGSSVPVPGHAPVDARDVHAALDAIAGDLDRRHPDRIGARIYLGYSLGAFHGFHIAAADGAAGGEGLVSFDRFVLLDSPVRLVDGMERLDAFNDVPLALPESEREAEARRILLKAVAVGKRALANQTGAEVYTKFDRDPQTVEYPPDAPLPFTDAEAQYLIAFTFRRSLKALLWSSQEREDLGILLTERRALRRAPPYEEIADYSFAMYYYGFVLPYHQRLGTVESPAAMVAANDLRAIAAPLRENSKLRVFVNRNDFLLSDGDLAWLAEVVGPERVRVFARGGHLGNLHRADIQAEILASFADLAPAEPPDESSR